MIVARYGEVHLKGRNRGLFLRQLTQNLRQNLEKRAKFKHTVELQNDRLVVIYVKDTTGRVVSNAYYTTDCGEGDDLEIVANTFGITSASLALPLKHGEILDALAVRDYSGQSFRINVNRADKKFPYTSMEFAAMCGEKILKTSCGLGSGKPEEARGPARVDLHNPETTINIDIRENDIAYLYTNTTPGVGGLPVGTAGRALVMLSGGIDSPVATWLAAKRGLRVELLHFASPPYTNAHAMEKIKRLRDRLAPYCGEIPLHTVNLTPILTEIKSKCRPEYTITLMRRFMVRIACEMCIKRGIDCIVTGENLAQVASQTIQGITTNNVLAGQIPILRPLITYDKSEIITLAKKIGTYDISIEPHADCCTVFVPDSPVIAPTIPACEREEAKLDVETLVKDVKML
jgi:thiamine biosynthesis protein ThiI